MNTSLDGLSVVGEPLADVWKGVLNFLPKLFVALVLFILLWIVGAVVGRIVAQIFRAVKIDNWLRAVNIDAILAKGGFNLDTGAFFGTLVKWFFIIVGLIVASDVLGLHQLTIFLERIVTVILPDVVIASLILIVGALVAHSLQKLVTGSAKAANIPSSHFMGGVAKWAVWIFAILAALQQLNIAGVFAQTLFQGLIAMLAIAGGLAFGLGGKDAAAGYLSRLRKDIVEK